MVENLESLTSKEQERIKKISKFKNFVPYLSTITGSLYGLGLGVYEFYMNSNHSINDYKSIVICFAILPLVCASVGAMMDLMFAKYISKKEININSTTKTR